MVTVIMFLSMRWKGNRFPSNLSTTINGEIRGEISMRFPTKASLIFTLSLLFLPNISQSQETVELPSPKIRGQYMKALKNRVSIKGFAKTDLSNQLLSDLLWSAFGVANKKTGRRTAPSAFNVQEIDIYVLKRDGVYRYNAAGQSLALIQRGDIRELVAGQNYAKSAAIQLLLVADYAKTTARYPAGYSEEAQSWAMLHSGFISQNITTFCAVKRLCSVVRSFGNRESLRAALNLKDEQKILISQAVGHMPR